jgi:hypothetical protein
MKTVLLSTIMSLTLSGCASFLPSVPPPIPATDPYTQIEERVSPFKETSIIEELNASGCDISRFETVESARKKSIIVKCK